MTDRELLDHILGGGDPAGRKMAGYTLKRVLSRGSAALVLEATQPGSGMRVALKVMRPGLEDKQVKRFKQEYRLTRKAAHANVVAMVGRGDIDGVPYFAMEWIEGQDLLRLVRERGKPPVAWTVETFRAIGSALALLHRMGILHRDMKPANIMIEEGTERPVLTDLGIAKRVKDVSGSWGNERESLLPGTAEGEILGTPAFMAPEQFLEDEEGDAHVGKATDIYGYGATLSYSLTGLSPFTGDSLTELFDSIQSDPPLSPRELRTAVPAALDRLVLSCMAKSPKERPWSIDEIVRTLGEIQPPAEPSETWPPPWQPKVKPAPSEGVATPSEDETQLGEFQLLERVAADLTGTYYLARQQGMQRVVLLKRPRDGRPATLNRLRREAQVLASLSHPGLLRVLSAKDADGLPYMTLEQPQGRSLAKLAEGRGLQAERAVAIVEHLARTIADAHQVGAVHGDLRAEGVYVDEEGIPHLLGLPGLRGQGEDPAQDRRTDVADLAGLLYQLLTGEALGAEAQVSEQALRAAHPDLPSGLAKLMQRARADGLGASELAQELATLPTGSSITRRFKKFLGLD